MYIKNKTDWMNLITDDDYILILSATIYLK